MIGEAAAGKTFTLKATPGYWALLYVAHGKVVVNDQTVDEFNLVVFEKDNEDIEVTAQNDAQLLYLSAEPLDEPVAAKDNYVMNTAAEIDQAIADYKNGLFGTLSF